MSTQEEITKARASVQYWTEAAGREEADEYEAAKLCQAQARLFDLEHDGQWTVDTVNPYAERYESHWSRF